MRLLYSINHSFGPVLMALLTTCVCVNIFADSASNSTGTNEVLPEPHKIVQDLTNHLLVIINDEKLNPTESPEKFYGRATMILEPVVAFDYIANGVMGNYAEQLTAEQRRQFTEAFKRGLISTYGKGLAGFSDSLEVTLLKPEIETAGQRKVSVTQKVLSRGTTTYVSYTMAQNRDKQWKLINVVLNGVNLGKTFRGQFTQAVQKNDGNVIKVIDTWGKEG